MHQVNVDEVTSQLSSLIAAAVRSEVVLIITDDQQTVRLMPVKHARQPRRAGSAKA